MSCDVDFRFIRVTHGIEISNTHAFITNSTHTLVTFIVAVIRWIRIREHCMNTAKMHKTVTKRALGGRRIANRFSTVGARVDYATATLRGLFYGRLLIVRFRLGNTFCTWKHALINIEWDKCRETVKTERYMWHVICTWPRRSASFFAQSPLLCQTVFVGPVFVRVRRSKFMGRSAASHQLVHKDSTSQNFCHA